MNQRANLACNFNCLIENELINEGLLKVTGSHVHGKFGNMFKTVQDKDIVTTKHEQEVIHDPSNSSNSDNLEQPLKIFSYCKSFPMRFFV